MGGPLITKRNNRQTTGRWVNAAREVAIAPSLNNGAADIAPFIER